MNGNSSFAFFYEEGEFWVTAALCFATIWGGVAIVRWILAGLHEPVPLQSAPGPADVESLRRQLVESQQRVALLEKERGQTAIGTGGALFIGFFIAAAIALILVPLLGSR